MTPLHRFAPAGLIPAFALVFHSTAAGQSPAHHDIHGVVSAPNGVTSGSASVFLLEADDVAITDTAGAFTIRTTARGTVTIVARRIGFTPAAMVVPVDTTGSVSITLVPQAIVLQRITAQAGAFDRSSTLSA